jgi:hypothetical protein
MVPDETQSATPTIENNRGHDFIPYSFSIGKLKDLYLPKNDILNALASMLHYVFFLSFVI